MKHTLTALYASFLILLLTGCSDRFYARKDGRRMDKAYTRSGDRVAAPRCAVWYPIISRDSVSVRYLRGKDSMRRDTVTGDCPPVQEADGKWHTVTIRVPCPPCESRVDTMDTYRRVTEESTAKLAAQEAISDSTIASILKENAELKKDNNRIQKGRNTWRGIGIGGILASLILLYLLIKPKFL
jgi:hypothetical protein